MKHIRSGGSAVRWVRALLFTAMACGQQPAEEPKSQEPAPSVQEAAPVSFDRFSFGLRLRTLPFERLSVMREGMAMQTTFAGTTAYDFNASTTSKSAVVGGGLAVEFRFARRLRLTSELLFHRLRYESSTATYWGRDDPATGNDERTQSSISEQTKGRLWDLPVLVHYRGLRSSGPLSHVWVGAGVVGRSISAIRTKAEIKSPDGSSTVEYRAATPSRRTLGGVVIAVGLRFVDDLNIKVTPEVRFTRWSGATFSAGTTRSPKSQLEFGVSFVR